MVPSTVFPLPWTIHNEVSLHARRASWYRQDRGNGLDAKTHLQNRYKIKVKIIEITIQVSTTIASVSSVPQVKNRLSLELLSITARRRGEKATQEAGREKTPS